MISVSGSPSTDFTSQRTLQQTNRTTTVEFNGTRQITGNRAV
jgi:hypothetical protein